MLRSVLVISGTRRCAAFPVRWHVQFSSQRTAAAAKGEIDALRQEIQTLQQLVKQSNIQSSNAERIVQQVENQSSKMEQSLSEIHRQVVGTSAFDSILSAGKEYVEHNDTLKNLLDQISMQARQHPRFINKYTLAALLLSLVILWQYWASIRQRTSKEVADIASRTLQQETLRQSIRETLDALATSPETLQTLTELLQTLMQDPSTQQQLVGLVVYAVGTEEVQNALLEMLQGIFQDSQLQELLGEFLLKGLDAEHVKEMLQQQTQDLVRETVSDQSVQRATGTGIRRSIWYALKPPFL